MHRALGWASLARRYAPAAADGRWRLKQHLYECGTCDRQQSMTTGTVFHRSRTDVAKWFVAAHLMGRDQRGISAKPRQRELAVEYQMAWTMVHKLRHGLSEDLSSAPFLKGNLAAKSHLLIDRFNCCRGRGAAFGDHLTHTSVVQDERTTAASSFRSVAASCPIAGSFTPDRDTGNNWRPMLTKSVRLRGRLP